MDFWSVTSFQHVNLFHSQRNFCRDKFNIDLINDRIEKISNSVFKQRVKFVMRDLENVLNDLNDVVGDMKTLVHQIDKATNEVYGLDSNHFALTCDENNNNADEQVYLQKKSNKLFLKKLHCVYPYTETYLSNYRKCNPYIQEPTKTFSLSKINSTTKIRTSKSMFSISTPSGSSSDSQLDISLFSFSFSRSSSYPQSLCSASTYSCSSSIFDLTESSMKEFNGKIDRSRIDLEHLFSADQIVLKDHLKVLSNNSKTDSLEINDNRIYREKNALTLPIFDKHDCYDDYCGVYENELDSTLEHLTGLACYLSSPDSIMSNDTHSYRECDISPDSRINVWVSYTVSHVNSY